MKVDILDINSEQVDEAELPDDLFEGPVRQHLFWEVVNWQRAKRRAGTHATKNRSAKRGGGRKPWQQKGTGRARHGSIRAPQWVGGGVVHGPSPKDYGYSIPKSKRLAALHAAVCAKAQNEQLRIVSAFDLPEIKTQKAVEMLEALGSKDALIVDIEPDEDKTDGVSQLEKLQLSIRNLPDAEYLAPEGLNVEDILAHELFLVSERALPQVKERLGYE